MGMVSLTQLARSNIWYIKLFSGSVATNDHRQCGSYYGTDSSLMRLYSYFELDFLQPGWNVQKCQILKNRCFFDFLIANFSLIFVLPAFSMCEPGRFPIFFSGALNSLLCFLILCITKRPKTTIINSDSVKMLHSNIRVQDNRRGPYAYNLCIASFTHSNNIAINYFSNISSIWN